MALLPQFPLGTVLFPTMVLPLQLFEPRYRQLAFDLLDPAGRFASTDALPSFGVTLIERGSEVGGDDDRSSIGCLAVVKEHRAQPDGRWSLLTVGTQRIRINQWLDDDPYPLAEAATWDDEPSGTSAHRLLEETTSLLQRTWALASEAGHDVGPVPLISDDLSLGSMQLSAAAPLGPFDQQRLLAAPSAEDRLLLLRDHLDDACELFELEIRSD